MSSRPCFSAIAVLLCAEIASAAYRSPIRSELQPQVDGASLEQEDSDMLEAEFTAYAKRYGRNYAHGSDEYFHRRSLFEQRRKAVKKQNAKSERLWEATTGPFADFTEAERSSMKGYVKSMRSSASAGLKSQVSSLMRFTSSENSMPKSFDWLNLTVAKQIPDQGQCGSCWAVTAKSVLDAHHEIHRGHVRQFAAQQIVSCVQNPRSCGGTGGCEGATVELAFDWVVHNGCAEESSVPYHASDLSEDQARCKESKSLSMPSTQALYSVQPSSPQAQQQQVTSELGGSAFGMYGYQVLEQNKEEPMIQALYQHGPVAASVAADRFFEYSRGIFDDCPKDTIVNHAVTMYGYGEAEGGFKKDGFNQLMEDLLRPDEVHAKPAGAGIKKYWLIRNSWGQEWGEDGFIRMLRYGDENQHCGEDNDNSQGIGCKGDPQKVTVCGMCGILFDSVVPRFHKSTNPASLQQLEVDANGKLFRRK